MEVAVPISSLNDFHFDSAASTPYVSAPSSPKRFGDPFDYYFHYTSAPASPSRVAAIFASSAVPEDDVDDFAFDFSGQLDRGAPPPDLTTADQLFEKGRIRPLKPPPRLYNLGSDDAKAAGGVASSPRSPKSPNKGLWSPRARGRAASGGGGGGGGGGFDPFTAAMVESTRERGRERPAAAAASVSSSRSRKGSRSLSPMRSGVAGFPQKPPNPAASPKASTSAASSTIGSECLKAAAGGGSGRKWRLRDLLLFRSASEGRVTGNKSKDPLRKFTIFSSPTSSPSFASSPVKRGGEDSRNSSFRSTDSGGSMRRSTDGGSMRRSTDGGSMRRGGASPHEMHYMSNRAVSEEMKKKTALPFNRQGLFGCLRFNPAVHSIARGFRQ